MLNRFFALIRILRKIAGTTGQPLQSEFVKNVLTLLSGTALGQLIALALAPILTRLFSLSDFATYEQYSFICGTLILVVTGRYEYAVMQPKEDDDARHVAALSIRVAFYFSLFVLLTLFFIAEPVAAYNHNPALEPLLYTLPIAVFFAGVFQTINYWFSRKKNYRVAAVSRMLYAAGGEPLKAVHGCIQSNAWGLVSGAVAGHIASACYSWWRFAKDEPKKIFQLTKGKCKTLARQYKAYPLYSTWGALLNSMAQWAHVAVFIFFYGEAAIIPVAYIALCRRIFFNPLGMLAGSYGQVFYQRISEMHDGKELKNFFMRNLYRFLAFAAAMVALVHVLPYSTLGFVFGEQWTDAMSYLRILSFWFALNFAISSLSFIFNRLHLQWYTLLIDTVHFISVLLAFAIAWYSGWNQFQAVCAMVWAKVIYLILNILVVIWFLNRNIKRQSTQHI